MTASLRTPIFHFRAKTAQRKANRGFALVATLSTLALLVLLVISLLGISSMARRTSSQTAAIAQARANARMAMNLALGDLQAQLGPDRRINCPSDIDSTAVAGQRNWLAVYDSWKASEINRPNPTSRFRRFLVSGNRTTLANRDAAKSTLTGSTIEMVSQGTLGSLAANGKVTVGLVPLLGANNSQVGQQAWWIGDENSKAKINAGRDFPDTLDPKLVALHSADSAPGTGFRMIDELRGLVVSGGQNWKMGDEFRGKSLNARSVDLLPGILPSAGRYFHDLTTASYGLLADVRNGSLKRDLSLYLERPYGSFLRQPLYTVNGTSSVNFNPDTGMAATLDEFSGITMEELWVYYNLYKEVNYNRPASYDDREGRRPAGFPTLLSGSTREELVIDRYYPYKRRVYSQVKYMLSLAAAQSATDPAKFDLRIAIDPIVVMWNPNNVAVEYQPGGYTTVGFSGLPYIAEFQTPSGTTTVPFSDFFPHTAVNQIPALIGRDHAIVLQPGESRVFSRVQGQGNSLSSGWRYTEGTLINHPDFPKNLERSSTVRLTLRPNDAAYVNYLTFWFGSRSPANATTPALQSGTYILRGDTAAAALPTITTPQTVTVGNIVDEMKIPHLLFSQAMRSETETSTPSKSWIWSNPSVGFRSAADNSLAARLSHMMEISVTQVSSWLNPSVQITPGNQAYWGGGMRADFGVPFFTHRAIPLAPIQSIASFQNSCANGMRRHWKDSSVALPSPGLGRFPASAEGLDGHRYLMPMGSKFIGNSHVHPLIPRDSTHSQVNVASAQWDPPRNKTTPLADHAYLANAALWDSWYFSSLTPQTAQPFLPNTRTLQQVFDGFFPVAVGQKPVPLPNARMSPYRSSDEAGLRSLVVNNNPAADAYRKLAAHLLVDGAFNVNSTSVHAWRVLLGSLRDHAIAKLGSTTSGLAVDQPAAGTTPVIGLLNPNGSLSSPTSSTKEEEQWRGFRTLTDAQIDALATELVREIQKRGPFLCLSDFINRRVATDPELARHGPLQAAIEATRLNGALDQGARSLGSIAGAPFPEAARGSRATGIPGHISQADLLTPLGPVLQARSDTFTIRAYGNTTNAAGKIISSASCEAVVQRVPEYIDSAEGADVAAADLTSPANRAFGRKFRIVSFRWLNADEI